MCYNRLHMNIFAAFIVGTIQTDNFLLAVFCNSTNDLLPFINSCISSLPSYFMLNSFSWLTYPACFFSFVLCCIVLYCIVLYCIVLYCIVLYCIVLYYIVLYCIVSHFFISWSTLLSSPPLYSFLSSILLYFILYSTLLLCSSHIK